MAKPVDIHLGPLSKYSGHRMAAPSITTSMAIQTVSLFTASLRN